MHGTAGGSKRTSDRVRPVLRLQTKQGVLAADWVDLPLAPGQQQGPAGMAPQIALFRHAMPDYSV